MGLIEKNQDRKELERQKKQAVLEQELKELKAQDAKEVERQKKKKLPKEDLPEIASETEEEDAIGHNRGKTSPLDIKIPIGNRQSLAGGPHIRKKG